jgi:hypothetical protein
MVYGSDEYAMPTLTSISKAIAVASIFPEVTVSIMMDGGMCCFYKGKEKCFFIDCYNDGDVILASWTTIANKTTYKDATREITNLFSELKELRRWVDDYTTSS